MDAILGPVIPEGVLFSDYFLNVSLNLGLINSVNWNDIEFG